MPMRNRVTPTGDIVAIPLRGAWLGNRGILHRGTDIVRFHTHAMWIVCALSYRGWRLPQWAPQRLTVLFFHDEAVSLAAGHRPCALCRRAAYTAYRDTAGFASSAKELDRQLHGERIFRGTHRRRLHPASWPELPDGAFVMRDDGPALVLGDAIVPWTVDGYGPPERRPRRGTAQLLTPPTSLAALASGYDVQLDEGALAATGRFPTAARPPSPGRPGRTTRSTASRP